jgi:chromosome partitioning protein
VGDVLVIAVVNLKGGSAKTTTAGYLCAALHEAGQAVLGVDADQENEGLLSWQADAELPWPVVGLLQPHRQLDGVAGDRYDVAVIDTPPMKAQRNTVASAMRAADRVVVTTAPNHAEYQRVPAVVELLEEVALDRQDRRMPPWAILLNRCKAGASSPAVYRQLAADDGYPILTAQIPHLERMMQAQGAPISNASNTAYGDAAMELLTLGEDDT